MLSTTEVGYRKFDIRHKKMLLYTFVQGNKNKDIPDCMNKHHLVQINTIFKKNCNYFESIPDYLYLCFI